MINNVFYFVLNMSIIGTFIGILILIVRYVMGKWIQKPLVHALWGIVLFRLLIPVSISSRFSLINFTRTNIIKAVAIPEVSYVEPELLSISATNSIQLAEEYFPIEYKADWVEVFFNISGTVWIIGMFVFIVLALIFYSMSIRHLKTAAIMHNCNDSLEQCKNKLKFKGNIKVYESNYISTPIVCGIVRPRIIVPAESSRDTLEYVLLHELSHIKRRDNLWKLLSVLAVCVHWFNPFAWLFLTISDRDMEGACDVKVLRIIEAKKIKEYAITLTELAQKQRVPFPALGNTAVKERIMTIVNYKRIPIIMIVVTTILCMIVAILLLTNPII